jgi:prepilin-type N-terminal cleavage/methylation domain-containing protein
MSERDQINFKKGMSLVEVLIAAVIIGILMTVLTGIFIQTIRIYYKTSARSELQGNVISALGLLARELMETDARSVRYSNNSPTPIPPDGARISFLSSVPLNGTDATFDPNTGKMEWKKYIIYYLINDPKDTKFNTMIMLRREYEPNTAVPAPAYPAYYNFNLTLPIHYTDFGTQCFTTPTAPGNRLLANGIKKLYITVINSATTKRATFDITIRKSVKNAQNETKEAQYKTTVYFRNCL